MRLDCRAGAYQSAISFVLLDPNIEIVVATFNIATDLLCAYLANYYIIL